MQQNTEELENIIKSLIKRSLEVPVFDTQQYVTKPIYGHKRSNFITPEKECSFLC